MKKFYDKALIETYMKQTKFESIISNLQKYLFVIQYKKGEFVSMPLQKEHLFQIIIQGSVSIYFIRDDGLLQMVKQMICLAKWKFSYTNQTMFMLKQMMM